VKNFAPLLFFKLYAGTYAPHWLFVGPSLVYSTAFYILLSVAIADMVVYGVFSSRKSLSFGTVAYFIVI